MLNKLTTANIIAFIIILFVDFYFSLWGKMEDVGFKDLPDLSNKDMESAKAVSLIIASPAYIISFLAIFSTFKIHFI